MKRNVVMLMMMAVALIAAATPPNLACESIFNRKDIRTDGHRVTVAKSQGNYYRSVTAENDPKLRDEIIKLVDKDKKVAHNVVETYKDGMEGVILNIVNNDKPINVGLKWNDNGYINLFIQGDPEAFE